MVSDRSVAGRAGRAGAETKAWMQVWGGGSNGRWELGDGMGDGSRGQGGGAEPEGSAMRLVQK